MGSTFVIVFVAVFGVGLYLLPSFVAAGRKCKAGAGIVTLNLLLGWTLLGWVGALIWASVSEPKVLQASLLRPPA